MTIGILVFDDMTQLDATGPYEALARIPKAQVLLVAKRRRVIRAAFGFSLVPHVTLKKCPPLDVICIPGGSGVDRLLLDEEVIAFVRRQARTARYVTSVCTGSLLLGAAGLLKGRRAACHWLSLPLLAVFGAKPSQRRIERDGKYITAGGITAGIDFGLWLAAKLAGTAVAKEIQLIMQYDPKPPFRAGTPRQAGKALTGRVVRSRSAAQAERAFLVVQAAQRPSGVRPA